jgi:hypothetical protein
VRGRAPGGGAPIATPAGIVSTVACQAACLAKDGCAWWVLRNTSSSAIVLAATAVARALAATPGSPPDASASKITCELHGESPLADATDCADCSAMGPKVGSEWCMYPPVYSLAVCDGRANNATALLCTRHALGWMGPRRLR